MNHSQLLQRIQQFTEKTQEELARDLDVSFPTINSWINGRSQPREQAQRAIESLYIKTFGDTSIQSVALGTQFQKLQQFKQQFPNPFSMLLSSQDAYDDLLISLTYHTNSIEGSTFNEPEVQAVLFDDVTIPNKTVREHQEAKNHQGALGFVMRSLRDGPAVVDEHFIKRIHQILMNGILYNAGEYRNHRVRIAGAHVPTSNYLSLDKHMSDFIVLFNKTCDEPFDQVKHMAESHARFEQIHPFSDGNGRVGRLLLLILAFRYGLAPVLIKKERKQAYYTYLEEAQVHNNSIHLTDFMYDAVFEGYTLLKKSVASQEKTTLGRSHNALKKATSISDADVTDASTKINETLYGK